MDTRNNYHMPRWDELPNINLFLKQVVEYVKNSLKFINTDTDILTPTMVNNYVKANLIDAPRKKEYSKEQISKIFVICILKQVYSMQEIKILINYALQDNEIEKAYNSFCDLFEQAIYCAYNKKNFIAKCNTNADRYLLNSVLVSCSYKIYVENVINKKNLTK